MKQIKNIINLQKNFIVESKKPTSIDCIDFETQTFEENKLKL